jgi:hypothetical protein
VNTPTPTSTRRWKPATATNPGWGVLALLAASCSSAPDTSGHAGGAGVSPDLGGRSGSGAGGTSGALGGAGVSTGGAPSGGTAGSAPVSGAGGIGGGGAAGSAGAPQGGGGVTSAGAGGTAGAAGQSGASGVAGQAGGAAGASGNGGGGAAAGSAGAGPVGCDWANADGRITLFDGSDLENWRNATTQGAAHWDLTDDGSMEVVPRNPSTNLETVMAFEDLCLHLEYQTPAYGDQVTGQERGNSGIYFRGAYEMQVLDTYGKPAAIDGCGAVYSVSPPLVVACNMQLVWNTYEIEFKASRWSDAGSKLENAMFVLATLNGMTVQRNVELDLTATTAGQPDAAGPRSLVLQDHGNPVRFRNIWAKIPRY